MQARLTQGRVGADGHVYQFHLPFASLHERFEGVGVGIVDLQAQGGIARESPEAANRIRHISFRDPAHNETAKMFHKALAFGEMLITQRLTVANDQVCLVGKDGGDQLADLAARILVVRVGVDDDVRPEGERKLHTADERARETAVAAVPQDVIRATFQRHVGSVISRTVIYHQYYHFVNPGKLPRDIGKHHRQMPGFVVGRDLDDEFHDYQLYDRFRRLDGDFQSDVFRWAR